MNTIKPLSAKECEKLLKQYREEIENGEVIIQIERAFNNGIRKEAIKIQIDRSWKLSNATILFLAETAHKYPEKIDVPEIPLKMLIALVNQYEEYEWRLLSHPKAPETMIQNILEKWAKSNSHHWQVISHKSTPPSILREIANINNSKEVREKLAEDPRTPGDILEGFARDPQLRQIVVRNLSTPLHILKVLREDSVVGNTAWETYLSAYRKKHFFLYLLNIILLFFMFGCVAMLIVGITYLVSENGYAQYSNIFIGTDILAVSILFLLYVDRVTRNSPLVMDFLTGKKQKPSPYTSDGDNSPNWTDRKAIYDRHGNITGYIEK